MPKTDNRTNLSVFLTKNQISKVLRDVNRVIDPPISGNDKDKIKKLKEAYFYLNPGDVPPTTMKHLEKLRKAHIDLNKKEEADFFKADEGSLGIKISVKARNQIFMDILNMTKNNPKTKQEITESLRLHMTQSSADSCRQVVGSLIDIGFLEVEPITEKIRTKFTLPYKGDGD